jgi:DNA-binding FadR family transcriptional regulator
MDGVIAAQDPVPFLSSIGTRVPSARLGVEVVRGLVTAIVTGEVEPGVTLPPEGVLAQQFGVSRTVLRESMKRLEEKGLVTVAQGRGTQVTQPTSWNVLDPVVLSAFIDNDDSLGVLDELSVVRASLEASMAGATAAERTAEQLEELRSILARMQETVAGSEDFRQADIDFHLLVMDLSGNRLAQNIAKILFRRALESTRYQGVDGQDALTKTLAEHEQIYAAIAAGAPDAAAGAMHRHITDAWERRRLPTHRSRRS